MLLAGGNAMAQTIGGSVYGGGNLATVGGSVTVNMKTGTVEQDVYGGGALANTNINNVTAGYGTNNETIPSTSTNTTTVNLTGGLIKGDAYGGGLGQLAKEGTAAVTYTQEEANAYNTEHNLQEGDEGFVTTETIKTPAVAAVEAVEAKVYGDISVNLGSEGGSSATAFNISYVNSGTNENPVQVVNSGRLFGCNNLNGSPLGNVTVTVWKTKAGNISRSETADKNNADATYEVAAVYGGGNLANYTTANKKTHVIINGCDDTSIQFVYGGGNAAAVPETDVDINAAYELGYVFGGGNGKDKYTLDGTNWNTNPGANVTGNANTVLTGGVIHEAFGGSNEKGTITGSVSINTQSSGSCALNVGKLYGAGKNADIEGDLIVVLGCMPGDDNKTTEVYGGAENANVKGNVELTITSGSFGKVFGGNNTSGAIFGHIKLNIEETGCTPIKIDELYLGGNMAPYSIYGYYQDGTIEGTDKPKYVVRQSSSDTHTAVYFGDNSENDHTKAPYANPELNIISATYIGEVFGGGYGANATLYGNPIVNINMIPGHYAAQIDRDNNGSADGVAHRLATIGDVYGGGDAANVNGNTTMNIGTATTVTLTSVDDDPNTQDIHENTQNVEGAYISGNVYGGGKLADVTGNTFVYVCAVEDDDPATTTVTEYASVSIQGTDFEGVTIGGNVFGGGKGEAAESGETAFTCPKAMVGTNGAGADAVNYPNYSDGNTTIIIGNGTVNGTVYGGGEIGRVEMNTTVTIGLGAGDATVTSTSSAPQILGNVFGGGKGKETHGYAALVRGNPTVTIAGNAKVLKSVYGGGEIASVARYQLDSQGEPHALVEINGHYSGYCTVNIGGYAEIGPNGMKMYHSEITDGTDKPDDFGHVFGAGRGILPEVYTYVDNDHRPYRIGPNNEKEYYTNEEDYFAFIQTQALSSQTDVTISDHAFVKGSVYGGSENGLVQFDTHVTVSGGQIGAGDEMSVPYQETDWAGTSTPAGGWKECASWTFEAPYAPYDPNANATGDLDKYSSGESTQGGRRIASDGHTYYGNVFGGGSGSIPYFDTQKGVSRYIMTAGQVKGNTNVTISGGHILTNVYGGCEATNVLGTANVTMTAGTIGVPRSDDDIIAHPLTGYLFGGGKGDQRIFFNKDTNVQDAVVMVEGGRIYGSVYGGGEDGHVLRNTTVTIKETDATNYPTKIGTKGTSYYDGHVFGGGRGFGGDALTAGNVGGAVTLSIEGGKILGSVYGGGRLASVGYGLYLTTETGYGIMRADNEYDGSYTNPSTENAEDFFTLGRGHITMTISGGTIGNDDEYNYDANNRLTHTKGGNVFAGGMGRLYKLDGTPNTSVDWRKMGCAKSTKLTISGDAEIKSCVYGGGELGQVVGTHTIKNVANEDIDLSTEIIIQGGTIGTEIKDNGYTQYTFGSVFGGGYGSDVDDITVTIDEEETLTKPKLEAGLVYGDTKVNMSGGAVKASIYGGGEMAGVGVSTTSGETTTVTGSTFVTVSGGSVGIDRIQLSDNTYRYFGGATMGNVYGGGSGLRNIVRSGSILKNATVNISGGTIFHNVYGGGAFGTVGNFTYTEDINTHKVSGITGIQTGTGDVTVTITGGTIGVDGRENGMVFGSSRGEVGEERDDWMAWVYDTHVTIGDANGGPTIKGSVYGSGENGHTWNDADVTIHGGTIGVHEGTAADATRGNLYGGGCGEDKYDSDNNGSLDMYNPLAGIVYGTTKVTIDGGTVLHNIYGAGALGSVGKPDANGTIISGGKTTIEISGGRIGYDGNDNGNVYGAARGDVDATQTGISQVKETEVSIQYATTPTADNTDNTEQLIAGSVFGGGQAGIVQGNVTVNMNGGLVLQDVYGGGALADTQTSNWDATKNTWAEGKTSASATTTVNLYGGMIKGDAYGGGLGQLEAGTSGQPGYVAPIEAKVYGDVLVNQGMVNDESKVTAFTITYLPTDELQKDENGDPITGQYVQVVNSGRIFGCNNLNGSPQGNVTVTVNGTTTGKDGEGHDLTRTAITRNATTKEITNVATPHVYEVAAVYGGGNLANYTPTVTSAKLKVLINSCNVSVEEVYGGGNAAEVPATDVEVMGAHEIEHVFGGGNGKDKYTLDGGNTWITNPGANIDGNTNTILKGGLIHEAYGGSNEKGDIAGDIVIDTGDGGCDGCPLNLEKMVGAGRNADVNGNLIVVMGCKPSQKIPLLYAGADNANVNGNVELTITSGNFGQVFGGNNEGGAIRGHIIVNIEETGSCQTPITIDELYLGGNNAAYSRFGYYIKTSNENGVGAPGETPELTEGRLTFMPRTSADDPHKVVKTYNRADNSWTVYSDGEFTPYDEPVLNVVSCTRIDQVYGGGYGEGGTMYANPTVNINMIPGHFAEDTNAGVPKVMTDLNIPATDNTSHLGIIGNVFGGGNAAAVIGNPTVNIGTATTVLLHESYDKTTIDETHDGYTYSEPQTVLGAYIHGNVYGGGNLADVGYLDDDTKIDDPNSVYCNTNVNICAKEVTVESEQVWQSVAVGSGGVTIAGHVFGGGKGKANTFKCEKAMIVGNTYVRIGNGTLRSDVYGGGEIGRVEQNTSVTVGLTSGTSAPVINGSVFGAGAGRATHGYSALVRGNSTVIVQASAKVGQSVYGGGEIATAGRYVVVDGLPTQTTAGGLCTVTVQGDAEITGNVFGAGQGVTPAYDVTNYQNFKSMLPAANKPSGNKGDTWDYYVDEDTQTENQNFVWKYYKTEAAYLTFLQSLALASNTVVTIDGNAKVKKNVYGGSESGFVQDHTQVTTQGSCVIGTSTTTGDNTTYTDGNVFGGGKGLASFAEAGLVKGTTRLNIKHGTMYGNVYGGGELGSVGKFTVSADMRTFTWGNPYNDTGVCNVNIAGGTIGTGGTMASDGTYANGNVFGAGKGLEDTFWCEKAIVYKANVSVTAGTVNGNVYGGGEVGRVETDAIVKIGPDTGTASPNIIGNVFGGGAGVKTHGYSALVRGNTYVTVQSSANVKHNVYGGGQIAAVGKYYLVDAAYKEAHPESNLEIGMPYSLVSDELGICNVTVIGSAAITGSVFGGGKGKEPETYTFADNANRPKRMMSYNTALFTEANHAIWEFADANEKYVWEYFDTKPKYQTFLETLGLTTQSKVTIGGTRSNDDTVTPSGSPTVNGNVYGGSESGFVQHNTYVTIAGGTIGTGSAGGNIFGGGLGLATFAEAGRVRGNTTVTVSGGSVKGNVYGGGSLGDVGTIVKSADYNYKWTDEANPSATYTWNNTGVCNVTINGGTIGTGVDPSADGTYANGNVYGAGKGLDDTWWCEKAIAYKTNVTITDGTIRGTVYGGGQVGRVETDAIVTIGTADETGTENEYKPNIIGNVFGAGAGVMTHGYSALVRGNSNLTVQGIALVGGSVYGGGEIASVGRFTVVGGLPKHPDSGGTCSVTIQDHAKIGASGTGHNVFGACKGVTPAYNNTPNDPNRSKSMQLATNAPTDANLWSYCDANDHTFIWRYYPDEPAYLDFLETLALTSHPIVTIAEDATVNGSVFGGGERGITLGSVEVNLNGGTVEQDVYGGGSLANSNKGNWETSTNTWAENKTSATYTTAVNLHSGTINGTVYGGGLGQLGDNPIEAKVYGDVTVKLNETTASDDCVVKGNVFGCNNVNGTPMGDVTVHVYKTQGWTDDRGTEDTSDDISHDQSTAKSTDAERTGERYELAAVYGGGNQAAYDPENASNTRQTEVIIDGCDLTSIEYVYGGGNAAAAPATHVTVNSCYEIGTVFAGGNGAGDGNPGADVGLIKLKEGGTAYTGAPTKQEYGSGTALAELKGGTIHSAFGGSNTRGNVRESATVDLSEPSVVTCPLCVDEVYGGGNNADQDGTSNINLGCISFLSEIYGGAKNADINNDIVLTIQSGRFNRVFGGNNLGGCVRGSITVNIEETGCHPIIIGQLFGGGNQAGYTAPTGKHGPTLNVKSFTSIGEIYGGGYGASAIVNGDTYVNINVCMGKNTNAETDETTAHTNQWIHFVAGKNDDDSDKIATVWQPEHTPGAIGTIGNVFGGGNEAGVNGNTNVQIGLLEYVEITSNIVAGTTDVSGYYTRSGEGTTADPYVYTAATGTAVANKKYYKKVIGANITGNVYGGGNAALVTGDTNVKIGTKE